MTADDRRRIREAIDAHQRNRRNIFISADEVIVCSACGCDSDTATPGCRTCTNRHLRRKWRADAAYRREERLKQRYWRHLKRQREQMA